MLIAEDEALVRQGIAALIEPEVDEIVEAKNGEEALYLLKNQRFDLALIDIGLPLRTGLDVLEEVRKRGIDVKIIILTGNTYHYSPKQIFEMGADAFLYKTVDAEQFLDTILAVISGEAISESRQDEGGLSESIAQIREALTSRELQIVKLIVEGSNNRQVSELLFISEHTVRKHRENINKKLKLKSPTALAAFAIKAGLV